MKNQKIIKNEKEIEDKFYQITASKDDKIM